MVDLCSNSCSPCVMYCQQGNLQIGYINAARNVKTVPTSKTEHTVASVNSNSDFHLLILLILIIQSELLSVVHEYNILTLYYPYIQPLIQIQTLYKLLSTVAT